MQIRDSPDPTDCSNSKCVEEYFHGVAAVLLCYDITDRTSLFEDLKEWNELCDKEAMVHVRKLLIGTKCDLNALRQCTLDDAFQMARKCGASHVIETSAKENTNVRTVFEYTLNAITEFVEQTRTCPFFG